ncbi:MAG: gliding motility protein GldN [Saprospiraceae bacterium]
MVKVWMCCLALVSSVGALLSQTEAGVDQSGTSWLEGGTGMAYTPSPPLSFPVVREADILWEKRVWRVIDTREKLNLPFRHPDLSLFQALYEGIQAGQITLYSPEDDRMGRVMPAEEWHRKLHRTDTVSVYDLATGQYHDQVVESEFDPARITRWRVQEVWYMDSRHSKMQVRIIGLAPMVETAIGGEQDVAFESPMCWINFAEARPWLAQYPVAQWGNDHYRTSWDDLLVMRRFSSYIVQENDMRGRRLQDYAQGEDLLLHSQKIDREIQAMEQDMWSY